MATLNPPLSDEAKPLAVVLLSGAQLWPSLQSVLHWQRVSGPVREVFLCPTHRETPARGAAQRLKRFLEHHFTGVRVVLPADSPISTPQEARDAVALWMNECPGRRWLLDTTGDGDLPALGLAGFAGAPEVQVVHRTISGEWFELARAADSGQIEARKLEGIDPHETDALPVADLVRSQFNGAAEALEFSFEPADPLPVKRLTLEGIARGWNWPAAFSACGLKGDNPGGTLFEQYVGAGLREFGVSNLARRLRLASKRDRKEKQSIDLVASHGGQVVAVDLKLRNEAADQPNAGESMISQIRQAADARQWLGGLAAQMVLARPCRLFSEAERELAKAHGLEVIDQRDAPRLFSRLAALLRIPALPPEMAEVEALLIEQVTRRGRLLVFGAEDDRIRQQEADSGAPEWVDVEAYLNRIRIERGQNWILWATRTEIGLSLERPASAPADLPDLIQTALGSFGRVRVESTPNGYEAVFPRDIARLAKLRQALSGFVNRTLETMVFVQIRPVRPNPPPASARVAARPVKPVACQPYPVASADPWGDLEAAVDHAVHQKPPSKP